MYCTYYYVALIISAPYWSAFSWASCILWQILHFCLGLCQSLTWHSGEREQYSTCLHLLLLWNDHWIMYIIKHEGLMDTLEKKRGLATICYCVILAFCIVEWLTTSAWAEHNMVLHNDFVTTSSRRLEMDLDDFFLWAILWYILYKQLGRYSSLILADSEPFAHECVRSFCSCLLCWVNNIHLRYNCFGCQYNDYIARWV